jgi:hypothetical protein
MNEVTIPMRAAAAVIKPFNIFTTLSVSSLEITGSSAAAKVLSSQRRKILAKKAAISMNTRCFLRNENMLFIRIGSNIFYKYT